MNTIQRTARWAVAASISAATLLAVGCASESKPAYPSNPPDSGMTGSTPMSLKVPTGAKFIAASGYPIATFTTPEDGTVYVYDSVSNTVPLVTSAAKGEVVDLSRMQSANSTLNPQHQFRVYFVPTRQATTLQSPLGS